MKLRIREAVVADLDRLAPLFDAYRVFYGKESDLPLARGFLLDRFQRLESTILLAELGDEAVGFTQLYPSFSSVSAARIFILNDLFVAPQARGTGAAAALLKSAADFGRRMGAIALNLSTDHSNHVAQKVYEREGWVRDDGFYNYRLTLT